MRLGGYAHAVEGLDGLPQLLIALDRQGLSTIPAPHGLLTTGTLEDCAAFGAVASAHDLVIGEAGMWANLLTRDHAEQDRRIALVRRMLVHADHMGCRCVVSLVGSRQPDARPLPFHPPNYGAAAAADFREVVLRILDGLHLTRTRYAIEPWHNTFFCEPEAIRGFIDAVDHPSFALHLDQMNLVSQGSYCDTTTLIETTFRLLKDRIVAVHLKDIRQDASHMFLKLDEVPIGDGVLDYDAYLAHLARLPTDTPCFCEHLAEERLYAQNFARLHARADAAGTPFLRRRVLEEAQRRR